MATGLEWMDRPKTITEGEYDRLEFAAYRLAQMRGVVRKLAPLRKDLNIPAAVQSLIISLTSMVDVDDRHEAETAAELAESN